MEKKSKVVKDKHESKKQVFESLKPIDIYASTERARARERQREFRIIRNWSSLKESMSLVHETSSMQLAIEEQLACLHYYIVVREYCLRLITGDNSR